MGYWLAFNQQKIPIWFKLDKEGTTKFPDSVWKMLMYTITWVWATYLVFFGEDQLFFHLTSHFDSECFKNNSVLSGRNASWQPPPHPHTQHATRHACMRDHPPRMFNYVSAFLFRMAPGCSGRVSGNLLALHV